MGVEGPCTCVYLCWLGGVLWDASWGVKVTTALLACTQCHDSKDRESLVKSQSTSTTQLRSRDHCGRGDRKSQRNWELPERLGLLEMLELSPA